MSNKKMSITKSEINEFKSVPSITNAQLTFKVNQWLFKPLGLWPLSKTSSLFEQIFTAIRIIMCLFFLAFVTVPGFFLFLQVQGVAARINVLTGPFIFYVMSLVKYILFILGQQNFANCIEHVIADWQDSNSVSDRNIMVDNARHGRMAAVICAIYMYSGCILYVGVFPLISGNVETSNNETIRPLAFPGYYGFFDPQKSPAHEIVYSFHCCCGFIMHSITTATCSLAVVFVMHACGQLGITIAWLKDLVAGTEDNENANNKFSKIVQHHVKTLRFINNIDKLLCRICLVEVVGCTISICVLGYNVLLQWSESGTIGTLAFAAVLISFVSNIFLLCYIGDFLIEKCKKVGETVYLIDWYKLPKGTALGLRLVIVTAQNPVVITAGKIIDLSLKNFAAIIRTSVAYLNILRTFQE